MQGSAGRADALVVAFAARRAIDRGVALGYLEPLLVERFGAQHQARGGDDRHRLAQPGDAGRADRRISTGWARCCAAAGPTRTGGPARGASLAAWSRSAATIRPARAPRRASTARVARLGNGEVDAALAETMRLPGAARPEAQGWIARARRLIAAQRALDEIESAALVGPVAAADRCLTAARRVAAMLRRKPLIN